MPSVIITIGFKFDSMASYTASATNLAGIKSRDAVAFVSLTASEIKSYTGTPCTSCPPLPGITPATIFVPYSNMIFV